MDFPEPKILLKKKRKEKVCRQVKAEMREILEMLADRARSGSLREQGLELSSFQLLRSFENLLFRRF